MKYLNAEFDRKCNELKADMICTMCELRIADSSTARCILGLGITFKHLSMLNAYIKAYT